MSLTTSAGGATYKFVDDRLGSSSFTRRSLNKVFPDHWSFMIGEIALYSFIVLLISGVYLTFFYSPSLAVVTYDGSYLPLRGVRMTEAYATTLNLSFDVRGGLLIRQIHHWSALLFVASIVVHLCRVFFTGAFRKPRELNWLVGVGLLVLAVLEGFMGYSLPDDLLSGTGLRIGYSILLAIPVVGTWLAFGIFGGDYPGELIIGRFYVIHILLIPGILLALITAHMGILWHQKHTQFRGPGRTETNVVGSRLYPLYAAKAGGFFFLVAAVMVALGGLVQINPVWLYGPYEASQVSAGSQPDWYIGFMDGALRLFPGWEFRGLGVTVPLMLIVPGLVIPGLMFGALAAYPWIEAKLTGDRGYHNLLDRPRDVPVRTAVGSMALTTYFVLLVFGANDIIAVKTGISLNASTYAGRILVFMAPPIAYWVAYRICVGLQRRDRERLEHGIETGMVQRLPSGEFVEVHAPLPEPRRLHLTPVEGDHADTELERPAGQRGLVGTAGRAVGGFFVAPKDGAADGSTEGSERRELAGRPKDPDA